MNVAIDVDLGVENASGFAGRCARAVRSSEYAMSSRARGEEVRVIREKAHSGKAVIRAFAPNGSRSREIWKVEDVAAYLRVHPGTVYRLVARGQLPAFRVGSDWRFFKDIVDAWLNSSRSQKPHNKSH